MVPAAARRSVTDTHGSFWTWPKWSTMLGMISATMVWSREEKKTLERMADTGTVLVVFVLGTFPGLCVFACESPSPPAYRAGLIYCAMSAGRASTSSSWGLSSWSGAGVVSLV